MRRSPRGPRGSGGLRILGGVARGRRLPLPPGAELRPTSARVREAIMSMAAPRLDGATVLDLFAGSGALGLEALSRGATRATFVERDPALARAIEHAARGVAPEAEVRCLCGDAASGSAGACPWCYDLVMVDPPYGEGLVAPALARVALEGLAAPGAEVYVVHERDLVVDAPPGWVVEGVRRHGDSVLTRLGAA